MAKGGRKKQRKYISSGFSQRTFDRPAAHTKPPKGVLIVTEGQNTEPIYFRSLAQHWSLHPHVTTIEPGGEGIPKNLVGKALEIQRDRAEKQEEGRLAFNQLATFDETWIVFDTDHAEQMGHLRSGINYARSHGVHIAHSTPCFEFWLGLHYDLKAPPMHTCKEAAHLLEKLASLPRGSHSKESGAAKDLIDRWVCLVPTAVKNALRLEGQQVNDDFPPNPSTSVHKLVLSMHEALPDELKKRFPLPE